MLSESDIPSLTGLTIAEAQARLLRDGPNELTSQQTRRWHAIALGIAQEPMFLLLLACGGIYLLLGDLGEALLLLSFVVVVMGIAFVQEHKTERVLEALRDLSSPRALVIRDGGTVRIAGREVVLGDLVVLGEGDRVPADACLLWSSNLTVDESLLTGESVAVSKRADGTNAEAALQGIDPGRVYASTLVVSGKGVGEVFATGSETEIGRIGKTVEGLAPEPTTLQRETHRIVRWLAVLGLGLCALVVIGYGLSRGDWLQGLLAGLAMAMAVLPEEFPVILTVFLALGAWRISRHQVLTRRVPAVETLGSATVLCSDKTGTLTQNRMSVAALTTGAHTLRLGSGVDDLPEAHHELVEYAILASQRDPFDPMERALHLLGQETLASTEHLHGDWNLVREYPLSPELMALSHVWRAPGDDRHVIAAKGAPEAIANLCHLDAGANEALMRDVRRLAAAGLRVVGVAKAEFTLAQLPAEQHDFDFRLIGLVGFADPIRPSVPPALEACRSAGIRVIMITGDYPETARSIAEQIGLPAERIITGPELAALDEGELAERVRDTQIFARMVPEQKLRLVQALKRNGEVVGMTGDGVNDAPALKAAHIGVAMGERGTDVAREAADLVLLNDDFASIVNAVRLGRRVADNLRKAMAFVVAVHVPIVGMSLLPVLLGWPLMLTPVHIVLLELIIDPACSIVFEAEGEEDDVMRRPPRDPAAALFGWGPVALSLLQGLGILAIVLGIYGLRLDTAGEAEARALAFVTLVVADLMLILVNRSWSQSAFTLLRRPNPALWWVIGATLGFLALALYVPALRAMFRFSLLHADDLVFTAIAAVLTILWFESFKWWRNRAGIPRPT